MPLADRKIPILTGVNDVPSVEGGANHPNDSLLCANYNALIDDISPKFGYSQRYVEYYVDGTTGNDITGEGSQSNPFATIQKAIDSAVLNGYYQDLFLYLSGTFENPSFDLTNFKLQSNYLGKNVWLYLQGTDATFNFSNLITNATNLYEGDSNFEFLKIIGNQSYGIYLEGITFNFNDYATGLFFDNKIVEIHNCTFSATANTRSYSLMNFSHCAVTISNSIFNSLPYVVIESSNANITPFDMTGCNTFIDNTSFLGLSTSEFKYIYAMNNQVLIRSDDVALNGQSIVFSGIGNRFEFLNTSPQQTIELLNAIYPDVLVQNKIIGV